MQPRSNSNRSNPKPDDKSDEKNTLHKVYEIALGKQREAQEKIKSNKLY